MNDSWGFPRIIARESSVAKVTPDAMRAWINADLSTGFLNALLQVSIMMVGLHSYCTRMLTRWQSTGLLWWFLVLSSATGHSRFLLVIPSGSYIMIANFNMDDRHSLPTPHVHSYLHHLGRCIIQAFLRLCFLRKWLPFNCNCNGWAAVWDSSWAWNNN